MAASSSITLNLTSSITASTTLSLTGVWSASPMVSISLNGGVAISTSVLGNIQASYSLSIPAPATTGSHTISVSVGSVTPLTNTMSTFQVVAPPTPMAGQSPAGTTVSTVGPVITTANTTSITLANSVGGTNGLVIAWNGVTDSTTGNVALLVYEGGNSIYQENQAGNWYFGTDGSYVASADPRISPAGTSISATGSFIYMANSVQVRLSESAGATAGLQLAFNGLTDSATTNAILVVYESGNNVFWENASDAWFVGASGAYSSTTSPLVTVSSAGASISTIGPQLIMANETIVQMSNSPGNTAGVWLAFNGVSDTTTANVILVVYEGAGANVIYQENSAFNWYVGASGSYNTATSPVSSPAGTSISNTTSTIILASGVAVNLSGAGHVEFNGVTDSATTNAIEVYYGAVGQNIYWENSSDAWFTGTQGSYTSSINPTVTVSPAGASISTVGPQLIMANGTSVGLSNSPGATAGVWITFNGTSDTTTANVILVVYESGNVIYQENSANNWYVGASGSYTPTTSPISGGGTSSFFSTSGRNIIKPNGQVYQPRGMNIWGNVGQDLSQAYTLISTDAPGTNFVRVYYDDSNNFTTNQTAINYLTNQGIVVCICDNSFHNEALGNGNPDQTTFVNRAVSIAQLFPSPLVFIEGENEPASGEPTANGQMMQALYNGIRAVDANKIVVFNGADDGMSAEILPSSIFSGMTNVVWDQHYYNWESRYSPDETTIQSQFTTDFNNVASFFPGPLCCFEYGEVTVQSGSTGDTGESGGATTLQVVHNAVTSGQISGDAYFQWYSGGVPSPYQTLSLFTGLTNGVPIGNTTNTCQVGNNASTGCGAVMLQWIAASQGTV